MNMVQLVKLCHKYLIEWMVGRQEVFAATGDEVVEDAANISIFEMLHGVAAQDEVVAPLQLINDNVMDLQEEKVYISLLSTHMINLELPALVAKVLLVLPYVGWDNVKPSELNICTVGQKVFHPIHVTAGGIKQTKNISQLSNIIMPNICSLDNLLAQGFL